MATPSGTRSAAAARPASSPGPLPCVPAPLTALAPSLLSLLSSPAPSARQPAPQPPDAASAPAAPPRRLHSRETFLLSLPSVHLHLHLPSLPLSLHGTLHLSRTRLVLVPAPLGSPPLPPLSLPLSWTHPRSLALSRPFFSSPHLSLNLTPTSLPPLFPPSPLLSLAIASAAGARVHARLETLEEPALVVLHNALQRILDEPGRSLKEARRLRIAADRRLEPTGEHIAFYDEAQPGVLLLAEKLTVPRQVHPAI